MRILCITSLPSILLLGLLPFSTAAQEPSFRRDIAPDGTAQEMAAPLGHASITKPPLPMGSGCARPSSWAAQADRLWMIDHWGNEPPFGDEPGALWRLVPETGVWSLAPTEPFGPLAVGVIEDAFGLRVYTSHSTPFTPAIPAGVSELDTATWTSTVLPIGIIDAPDIDDYFLHAESIP